MNPHENAKNCIRFYYEKITGTNLQGGFPHPINWQRPEYMKAVEKAVLNLSSAKKEAEVREIYQNFIP
jgi:hypothetical protein